MQGKTVAVLESRAGTQVADLVRKYGGTPLHAPALAEVPDLDHGQIRALVADLAAAPAAYFIFQTGVGTRALFAATDAMGLTTQLLEAIDAARVVVRGPKPTAALRARGVRIDLAANDPFTTHEVIAELSDAPLHGARVVVQRHGDANPELTAWLTGKGASVTDIATYRWAVPADTAPLEQLIGALARGEVDLVAFTSAAQADNLFTVADVHGGRAALGASLERTKVASIGPACSNALHRHGVRVDVEAQPPKLGPFFEAINRVLKADDAAP